jgi:hypothetical protein
MQRFVFSCLCCSGDFLKSRGAVSLTHKNYCFGTTGFQRSLTFL